VTCDVLLASHDAPVAVFCLTHCRLWTSFHLLLAAQQQSLKTQSQALQQHAEHRESFLVKEAQMQQDKKAWQSAMEAAAAAAAAAVAEAAHIQAKLDQERALVRKQPKSGCKMQRAGSAVTPCCRLRSWRTS
jgi:hypothetical protein